MWTLVRLAWRNMLRQRRRSLITASAMATGILVCMTMLALTEGMYGQMRDVLIAENTGHVQVTHAEYPTSRAMYDTVPMEDGFLGTLLAEPTVTALSPRLYGNALLGGDVRTSGVQLVGVDPTLEGTVRDFERRVIEGRWLTADEAGVVVVGEGLAEELEVGLGSTVVAVTQAADGSLGNALYEVVGIYKVGVPALDRMGAFLSLTDLQELLALEGQAHEIAVLGASDEVWDVDATKAAVAGHLPESAIARGWLEVDAGVAAMMGLQDVTAAILIFFFLGVAAISVVNTMLMAVFERTREIGVMRALGVRPGEVVALVLLEAVMIAVLASVVGVALGLVGDAWLVTQGIDLTVKGEAYSTGAMTFDPIVYGRVTVASVLQPVVGVFLFSVLAAVWPAVRAARLRPVEALRAE